MRSRGDLTGATPDSARPLRQQVSRACDQCRARRIKCDNQRPCRRCLQRGVQCAMKGGEDPGSLPQALKEIEALRLRIYSLETEIKDGSPGGFTVAAAKGPLPTPSDSPAQRSDTDNELNLVPCRAPGSSSRKLTSQWEGLYVAAPCSEQRYYYGPASGFCFISRLGTFLGSVLQQPVTERSMQPHGPIKSISSGAAPGTDMSRAQEEYFLALFWESYHVLLPIIDEADFRAHYASLWSNGQTRRRSSPLVDIVLALCLQYGYSFLPHSERDAGDEIRGDGDGTTAGRGYFRRCQTLLVAALESPTLMTVRCQIFSVVYLCCVSFHNMAHVMLASLVRTAQLMGLHLEPSEALGQAEREMRKRIWWSIFLIETKTDMKLGRPNLIDLDMVTVGPLSDDLAMVNMPNSSLGAFGSDVTWLTYTKQVVELVRITHDIHFEAWEGYGSILHQRGLRSGYSDMEALESCAKMLSTLLSPFKQWTANLPHGIRLERRDGGQPFGTACLPYDHDSFAPAWLQKHRVVLELVYHTMLTNLYRPFITFTSSQSSTYAPTASRHAASAVQHAMAYIHIMHQTVTETDLLNGWTEFFPTHWNETITIIGFILANPVHPSTPAARKAIEKCLSVCDIYGAHFAVCRSAAAIARDLVKRVDEVADRIRSEAANGVSTETIIEATSASGVIGVGGENSAHVPLGDDSGNWNDFMDWALTVDTFNSFEEFYNLGGTQLDDWGNLRP